MSIQERILQYIDFKGITPYKFCKDLGFSMGYLDKRGSIGTDKYLKIIEYYIDINPDWLLTGNGDMLKSKEVKLVENENSKLDNEFIPLIPIDAIAGYGTGEVQISKKELLKGYKIPEFKQRGVEYIIRVNGSSMYPKYSSGDLLGCKTVKDLTFFQWGKVYVLDTDQGPMVKRLFPVTDNEAFLECRSDNIDYPPFKIHKNSIYNVAIVIGVLRME